MLPRLHLFLTLAALASAADAAPYTIMDAEGFGAEMPAATVPLPDGWQGKGRVAWLKPCSGNDLYEIIFSATSADGQSGMRIMPGHRINWNDVDVNGVDPFIAQMAVAQAEAARNDQRTQFRNSNCHVGQVSGTQKLIDTLILSKSPAGAKVTRIEPNEALRKTYADSLGKVQGGGKTTFDAVIVYLTYPGTTGPVEEMALLSWYMFADDPAMRVAGMPGIVFQSTTVDPITLIWAPADRAAVDLPAGLAVIRAIQPDPVWLVKLREAQAALAAQNKKNREDSFAASQAANKARQEAFDRQNAAFLEMLQQ